MAKFIYYFAKSIRPRQWLKSFTVFTAIVFTGQLFSPEYFFITIKTLIIVSLASSGIYLINDIIDMDRDRLHPFKKNRPIAAGKINIPTAFTAAILLISVSLFFATKINGLLFFTMIVFVILQLSYSLLLKHIAIIDILAIASAFILRIFAGEVATGYHISIWLFLAIVSSALFLAIGKRRCELTLLQGITTTKPLQTRATLGHYSEKLLDVYTSIFATSTWLTYSFYSFLEKPPTLRKTFGVIFEDYFPVGAERKWLMLTIPFVIYGIMRYTQLIYQQNKGESPERVLTSDLPLLITIILWGGSVIFILYGLGR